MKIPFSPPDISEREVALVSEALRSGWITTGPKTKEFEKQFHPERERAAYRIEHIHKIQSSPQEFRIQNQKDRFARRACN